MADTIEAMEPIAFEFFDAISPAHDWSHVRRVFQTAETIAEEEGANGETIERARFRTVVCVETRFPSRLGAEVDESEAGRTCGVPPQGIH